MKEHKTPFRIAVFISGRGSNFEAIANAIGEQGWNIEIARVISDRPSAKGLELARARNIPTTVVPRRKKERSNGEFNIALAEAAAEATPDLIVLAGFMRILSPEFVTRFPYRIINIHPSLLPSFPGLHVHEQALAAGVRFSGCTVHYVTEDLDAGPIIAQSVVPVLHQDSPDTLAARVLKTEHQLYPAVVHGIATGGISISDKNETDRMQVNVEIAAVNPSTTLLSLR